MLKKLTKENKGFTIIEVLIVLAIAGLILLIVFLAVPALQRNSRNTQRRNDVAALLAGATEFSNNNNGVYPTGWTAASKQYTGPAGTGTVAVNTGFYQGANVSVSTAAGNVNNTANDQSVIIAMNHNCFGPTVATPVNRSVAALFEVEAAVQQCQSS